MRRASEGLRVELNAPGARSLATLATLALREANSFLRAMELPPLTELQRETFINAYLRAMARAVTRHPNATTAQLTEAGIALAHEIALAAAGVQYLTCRAEYVGNLKETE